MRGFTSSTWMAPPKVAWLFTQHTVVRGLMKRVELIIRYIAPPWLTPLLDLLIWFPLLIKLLFPLNVSVLLQIALRAPPSIADLLQKLLVPLKLNEILVDAEITPLFFAELSVKLLVPLKVSTTLLYVLIAPPPSCAKLLIKLLVPLKVSTTLAVTEIAPPAIISAKLSIKSLVPVNLNEMLILA